jgi:hypothetical protein
MHTLAAHDCMFISSEPDLNVQSVY